MLGLGFIKSFSFKVSKKVLSSRLWFLCSILRWIYNTICTSYNFFLIIAILLKFLVLDVYQKDPEKLLHIIMALSLRLSAWRGLKIVSKNWSGLGLTGGMFSILGYTQGA